MLKATAKFLLVASLTWLAVVMGLSVAAQAGGIPDTDTWTTIIQVVDQDAALVRAENRRAIIGLDYRICV